LDSKRTPLWSVNTVRRGQREHNGAYEKLTALCSHGEVQSHRWSSRRGAVVEQDTNLGFDLDVRPPLRSFPDEPADFLHEGIVRCNAKERRLCRLASQTRPHAVLVCTPRYSPAGSSDCLARFAGRPSAASSFKRPSRGIGDLVDGLNEVTFSKVMQRPTPSPR
jgi:hypothetical protein